MTTQRRLLFLTLTVGLVATGARANARPLDQVTTDALTGHRPHAGERPQLDGRGPIQVSGAHGGLAGIDSIANFTGQYSYPGVDWQGNPQSVWPWAMVGRSPRTNRTSIIGAPIIPVSIDMRNADGTPRYVNGQRLFMDATQFVRPVVNSPIFHPVKWPTSEFPTQFLDALFRAQFWRGAGDGDFDRGDHVSELWHTFLLPVPRTPRVMKLNAGTYHFALNADGTCCAFVLVDSEAFGNALFPATADDTTTPIGAAEHAHEMTTKDLSTLLFPNTFLYDNGDPSQCCTVGYHAFDMEPDAQGNFTKFYVMNYSSWVTPGLFGPDFADVTALSHELSEAFNDPFVGFDGVHNMTQWWQAPWGLCQNNLETGDVIEGLDNVSYPVTIDGFTYHPQNEALLQWFAGESPSSAWHGAYSFPDPTVLTAPAPSLGVNCGPLPTPVAATR